MPATIATLIVFSQAETHCVEEVESLTAATSGNYTPCRVLRQLRVLFRTLIPTVIVMLQQYVAIVWNDDSCKSQTTWCQIRRVALGKVGVIAPIRRC